MLLNEDSYWPLKAYMKRGLTWSACLCSGHSWKTACSEQYDFNFIAISAANLNPGVFGQIAGW